MKNNRTIQIHQVLHGYSDGHTLLKSSQAISRDVQRHMLILSDLSGPDFSLGFESYLTGYSLPGNEMYALARTWYAPEMKRPGCVWTHTLLIDNKDFAYISDLSMLLRYFTRPSSNQPQSSYGSPILLKLPLKNTDSEDFINDSITSGNNKSLENIAMAIIYSLYAKSECKPIILITDQSHTYEKLILALWSQQWPNLRKSFLFCSGSLSYRSINGGTFDLQAIPAKSIRQFSNQLSDAHILEPTNIQSDKIYPDWVHFVTYDLFQKNDNKFRKFIWEVGSESPKCRSEFARFAEIYGCMFTNSEKRLSIESLLEKLHDLFSSPTEGLILKSKIIGPFADNQHRLLLGANEFDLLNALTLTKYFSMFNPRLYDLRNRARIYWNEKIENSSEFVLDLIKTDVNPLNKEIFLGIVDAIQPEQLIILSKTNSGILFTFVDQKPSLASCTSLWQENINFQSELFDHVVKASPSNNDIESIIKAMLDAKTDYIANQVYDSFGAITIHTVLDWFDKNSYNSFKNFTEGWKRILKNAPEDCLLWLSKQNEIRPGMASLIASILNPNSEIAKDFGTEYWLKLIENHNNYLDDKCRRSLSEFLLPFAFTNPGPNSDKLVSFSFLIIHNALEKNDLKYDSWKQIEPMLPQLSFFKSWDKCERLRRGLIDKFMLYNWSIIQFLKCATDEALLQQLLNSALETKDGKHFLKKLIKTALKEEHDNINNNQEKILNKYKKKI